MKKIQDAYAPPTDRPHVDQRVHEPEVHGGRSGTVIAVLDEPEIGFVFVVRWWIPWKSRHAWACHTPPDWELGLVRPGPRPNPRKA